MKLTCIIVDDEPASRDILRRYIKDIPDLELQAECKDALEANRYLTEYNTDLILLDINMPRLSGVSFARSLSDPPLIIFTTAYPEYAVEGFELNAVDYLVKPFSFERFLKAINKATSRKQSPSPDKHETASILLRSDKKIYKVDLASILFNEGCGDYVKVRTADRTLVVHDTMKGLLSGLPEENFMRIHKSYAVNLDHIEYIEGNHVVIGSEHIPVSPQYKEELLSRMNSKP